MSCLQATKIALIIQKHIFHEQYKSGFKTGCQPLQFHLWSPLGLSSSFPQATELSPGLILFLIKLVNLLPPLLI